MELYNYSSINSVEVEWLISFHAARRRFDGSAFTLSPRKKELLSTLEGDDKLFLVEG